MPLFNNSACPVCNRVFEDGDDIVYCPECGTPHHRECYNAVGHCVNRGLHSSGYSYYDDMKAKETPVSAIKEENDENDPASFFFGNSKAEQTDENPAQPLPFVIPSYSQFDSIYEKDDQKIDGESVADFAVTIRTNIPRFINLFKEFEYKGRKTSWNWGAFFFGSLYLFFRKMYRQGFAFMSAFVAIVYASSFAILKLAPKYVEAAKNFADLYAQNKITTEDIEAISKVSDLSTANTIIYIAFFAVLALRIILALFTDRFYKKTVSEFIKNVNKQLGDGASFFQPQIFTAQNNELTQLQMKRYYLARRGGTSLFLPLGASFVIYFLTMLAYQTLFF